MANDTKSKFEDAYKQIANQQMEEGTQQMASLLANYYINLVTKGVFAEHAIMLVVDFQRILLQMNKNADN